MRLPSKTMRLGLALGCLGAIALVIGGVLAFGEGVSRFMLPRLTYARHLPEFALPQDGVAYILGGTPDSLQHKFEIASRLLHERKAARILVLSRSGLMAFSPALNRNLTANEWAVENLAAFGVPADRVEFVALEERFFGTWSEAWGLSRIAKERNFQRLILVTSPYHSRRAWESFTRAAEESDTRLYLYQSSESASLSLLLPEYVKLILYRTLLY